MDAHILQVGIQRLEHWLTDVYEIEERPYTRLIGKCFIMGMVERARRPGCKFDYMLIIKGEQGLKKSTAFRQLAYPFFTDNAIRMGDKDCVVVGVLAESGPIPFFGTPPIYVPFGKSELTVNNSNAFFPTRVFARLSPDSTATTAESELRTLKPNYPVPVPKFYEGQSPAVVRFDAISTGPGTSKYHLKNWAMLGAVGLLYLIACVEIL